MGIKYCVCGEEAIPIIISKFEWQGKVVHNVPGWKCTSDICEYSPLFSSNTIERVEELISFGENEYRE